MFVVCEVCFASLHFVFEQLVVLYIVYLTLNIKMKRPSDVINYNSSSCSRKNELLTRRDRDN